MMSFVCKCTAVFLIIPLFLLAGCDSIEDTLKGDECYTESDSSFLCSIRPDRLKFCTNGSKTETWYAWNGREFYCDNPTSCVSAAENLVNACNNYGNETVVEPQNCEQFTTRVEAPNCSIAVTLDRCMTVSEQQAAVSRARSQRCPVNTTSNTQSSSNSSTSSQQTSTTESTTGEPTLVADAPEQREPEENTETSTRSEIVEDYQYKCYATTNQQNTWVWSFRPSFDIADQYDVVTGSWEWIDRFQLLAKPRGNPQVVVSVTDGDSRLWLESWGQCEHRHGRRITEQYTRNEVGDGVNQVGGDNSQPTNDSFNDWLDENLNCNVYSSGTYLGTYSMRFQSGGAMWIGELLTGGGIVPKPQLQQPLWRTTESGFLYNDEQWVVRESSVETYKKGGTEHHKCA